MLCVIPGVNLKVFAKAIHALSKIGDEIYFEAATDGLSVRTVNSTRSAFATFFFKPSFFIKYQHNSYHNNHSNDIDDDDDGAVEVGNDKENKDTNNDDGDKKDSIKCKVYTKSCLTVFKGGSSMDKLVDRCRITLDPDADRFIFTLFCRYGLVKTFKLTYSECEKLKAIFSTQTSPNSFKAHSKLLSNVLGNFQTGVEELKMQMLPHTVSFQNHLVYNQEISGGCVKTEVVLHSSEFEEYSFSEETTSVFCLKEFRAFLFFCEISNLEVSVYADHAGRPIVFSLDSDPSFESHLVLATVASEHFGDTKDALKSKDATLKKVKRKKKMKRVEEDDDDEGNNFDTTAAGGGDMNRVNSDHGGDGGDCHSNDTVKSNVNVEDGSVGDNHGENEGGGDNDDGVIEGDKDNDDVVVGGDGDDVEVADSCGEGSVGGGADNDVVEASPPRCPPSKKLKSLFCGLSQSPEQSSFDKSNMVVLAEDSDSD